MTESEHLVISCRKPRLRAVEDVQRSIATGRGPCNSAELLAAIADSPVRARVPAVGDHGRVPAARSDHRTARSERRRHTRGRDALGLRLALRRNHPVRYLSAVASTPEELVLVSDALDAAAQGAGLQHARVPYHSHRRKNEAKPRKLRKPTTSVTVVRITAPDNAGSIPIRCKINGIATPDKAAASRFRTMATAIIVAIAVLPNQNQTTTATRMAQTTPLMAPTAISLKISQGTLDSAI